MISISRKLFLATAVLLALVALLAVAAVTRLPANAPMPAFAGDVGTYEVQEVASGDTTYTTAGGNLTGWESAGYGSVVIQAISDASATTSTLTVYPQYSNEIGVPCDSITNWFGGTDLMAYSFPAQYQVVRADQIDYTTNSTDSLAFTSSGSTTMTGSVPYVVSTTFTYATPSVTTYTLASASSGYSAVTQSLALTGDTYGGREFAVYGRCMRLNLTVSYGTVTPTIYVMMRDIGQ